MRTIKRILPLLLCLLLLTSAMPCSAAVESGETYDTYNYSFGNNGELLSAEAYSPVRIIRASDMGLTSFRNLSDIFIVEETGDIYLADTDNNRIIRTDAAFTEAVIFTEADGTAFSRPSGIYADEAFVYIADTGNKRVVKMTRGGETVTCYDKPNSPQFSAGVDFKPQKVVVTAQGEISIVCEGIYEGLVTIDQEGNFLGYSGTIPVRPSLWDLFWRLVSTREQLKSMTSFLPVTYINADLDEKDFVYATSQAEQSTMANSVQRLNPGGNDVLINSTSQKLVGDLGNLYDGRSVGASVFGDVVCLPGGLFACADQRRAKIFLYDDEGEMLFAFGGLGNQEGNISMPSAIDNIGFDLYVTDSTKGQIVVYGTTVYGQCLIDGILDYDAGDYESSRENFYEAFRYNTNSELAYLGIGKAQMREGNYREAMLSFRLASSRTYYSRALKQYRREVLDRSFSYLFAIVAVCLAVIVAVSLIRKYRTGTKRKEEAGTFKEPKTEFGRKADKLLESVDHAFYCMMHPFKGFHELKYEHMGSMSGAVTILILYIISAVVSSTLTGFLYGGGSKVNPLTVIATVCLPVLLFVVANWCITTLMEGEGSMRDIFIAVCYALMPMVIGRVILMALSNFLTLEESSVYNVVSYGLTIYTVFLLLVGNMLAHGFTMSRTVAAAIVTAIAMAVIVFIGYLFFNLLFEVGDFISQIYREIVFRV